MNIIGAFKVVARPAPPRGLLDAFADMTGEPYAVPPTGRDALRADRVPYRRRAVGRPLPPPSPPTPPETPPVTAEGAAYAVTPVEREALRADREPSKRREVAAP